MNRLNGMSLSTVLNHEYDTMSVTSDGVSRMRHCINVLLPRNSDTVSGTE